MSLRLSVLDQSPASEGAPRTTAITSTARLAALERHTNDGTTRRVDEVGETSHFVLPDGQYLLLGQENTSNHNLAFVTVEHERNPAQSRPYRR